MKLIFLVLLISGVCALSEQDKFNPNFYQLEGQRISNSQYYLLKSKNIALKPEYDVETYKEFVELSNLTDVVNTVKNVTLKDCDKVKEKVFALLDKIKVTKTAISFANKFLHVSVSKPVPMTFSTELDDATTCLPVTLKVEVESPTQELGSKNFKVAFTGLWGKGTIDKKDNETWMELQVGWKTGNLTLFGKSFPFEDNKFMSWSPDKVTMPLPRITIGKLTLSDLSIEWEREPETWSFTSKANWPFELAVSGKFWTNASATNQTYTLDGSSTITSLNLGGSIFGVKLDGLTVSGHVDDKYKVGTDETPAFKVNVGWTKGVVSTFGRHTVIPLAAPMEIDNNGISVQLSSLDLGVVSLGATSLSLTRSPYQFTAVGSVVTPHPIDFDCTFPLAACKEEGKHEGDANCTKPHPSVALSTKFTTMSLGTDDFGVKAEGIAVSGSYTNGAFKLSVHFEKLTAKVFGSTIVMNQGAFSYEKDKLVINIPQIVLKYITLPPGTLTITNTTIDYASTLAFRGKILGFTSSYNRNSGDVSASLTTEGVLFAFSVKKGSFEFGSLALTPRSMGIEYTKETKALAFKAEAQLVITLFSLKVTFDPVSLYLSDKKVAISATITNFEIYGAKPKINLAMSYEEATGAEASLQVEMTSSDVQKIVKGIFNSNAALIKAGCVIISPIAAVCNAVSAAVNFVGDMLSKLLAVAPSVNLDLSKDGIKLYLGIPIGDGLASLFPFAKFMKGIEMQLGTELDFSVPANSIPGLFFRIQKNDGSTIWFFRSEWVKCPIVFRFGIKNMEFKLKTLPDIVAEFSGTIEFHIMQIFDWAKHDEWVLRLGGYFKQAATGATEIGLFFEVLKPVINAFGIPKFNLHYIKIALAISPQSAVILKSLELSITADFGPITGVTLAGKVDIVDATQNYFYFGIDAVTTSKVIGAIIGQSLSSWPAFLDFKLDKTSMYFAFSNVQVNLGGGKTIDLKPGFAVKTGIRFLAFVCIIDAGVYLTGAKIPSFYIKQFTLDMRQLLDGIQALFDKIGETVSNALSWKPLKVALSMMGKALLSFFPLQYLSLEGLEVNPAKPMEIKLPSIELGFSFVGVKTGIKIPGFGVQEGLANFPKLFKAALRAFADCWKWIKTLGLKLWENIKALVGAAIKFIGKALGAAIKWLGNAIKDLGKALGNAAVAVGKAFVAAGKAIADAAKAIAGAFTEAGKQVAAFFNDAGKVFGKVADGIVNAFKNPAKTLKAVGEFFAKVIDWGGMLNAGKKALEAVGNVAKAAWDGLKNVGGAIASGAGKAVKAVGKVFRFFGRRRLMDLGVGVRAVVSRRRLVSTDRWGFKLKSLQPLKPPVKTAPKPVFPSMTGIAKAVAQMQKSPKPVPLAVSANKPVVPVRIVPTAKAVPTPTPAPEKNPAKKDGVAFKFTPGESFSRTLGVQDLFKTFQNLDTNNNGQVEESEIDAVDFIGGKSCKNLGWHVKKSTKSCGTSISGKCAEATHDTASETCEKLGARLCTQEEIEQGVPENPAKCPNTHIWTSTQAGCSNGEFQVVLQGKTKSNACRKTFSNRIDPQKLFLEKLYSRNPQSKLPEHASLPDFSFSEMVVRACNSNKGCTEGTSCKLGQCVFPNGNHKMESIHDQYWMARRAERRKNRDISPIVTNDADYEPLEALTDLELSVQCAGGCPEGTICGERATCVFPPVGHPEFVEMQHENVEVDHDPTGQIRCCGDETPEVGDDKSFRDTYWGGANIITADNKLSFSEMVIWTMGGQKGLDFASVKVFLEDAKLIQSNPEWEPHFKGYKLFKQFHPQNGHLKEIKNTKPEHCEQECTSSPGVGLCEGFVVLQDTCYLKTTAFTNVVTGDAAAGTYYFQKQHDETDPRFDRAEGPNRIPSSLKFFQRNLVVSAKKCADLCEKPVRGVCAGYLIDSRGICHLASSASGSPVIKQGYNFFFNVGKKAPSVDGYSKKYDSQMSGDLQKYGRRSVEECANLCDRPQWGICAGFELNSNGECTLKSAGGFVTGNKKGYTVYVKKDINGNVKALSRDRFTVTNGQFSGTAFYTGKVTASVCRKACDSVPMFIGEQRVRASSTAAEIYCAGFHVQADGTCQLFSKITKADTDQTSWAFRNQNTKIMAAWSFNIANEAKQVCTELRAKFIAEANKDHENADGILESSLAACKELADKVTLATKVAAGLCDQFKQKFIDSAKDLETEADMKSHRQAASDACAKQGEIDALNYCQANASQVCANNRGKFLDDCKTKKTKDAAVASLTHWKC